MKRPFAALAVALIAVYKLALAPALALFGVRCRHWPTCSSYAADAIERHGAWAGGWIALSRLSRCRPFGSSGIDPAPEVVPQRARWWTPWRYGDWRGPRPHAEHHRSAAEGCENAKAHLS
jgi:hypothetical protein